MLGGDSARSQRFWDQANPTAQLSRLILRRPNVQPIPQPVSKLLTKHHRWKLADWFSEGDRIVSFSHGVDDVPVCRLVSIRFRQWWNAL